MLTSKQKATTILALSHLIREIHALGNPPSAADVARLQAVVGKVPEEDQILDHTELRALALDAMEALVAELH